MSGWPDAQTRLERRNRLKLDKIYAYPYMYALLYRRGDLY